MEPCTCHKKKRGERLAHKHNCCCSSDEIYDQTRVTWWKWLIHCRSPLCLTELGRICREVLLKIQKFRCEGLVMSQPKKTEGCNCCQRCFPSALSKILEEAEISIMNINEHHNKMCDETGILFWKAFYMNVYCVCTACLATWLISPLSKLVKIKVKGLLLHFCLTKLPQTSKRHLTRPSNKTISSGSYLHWRKC